MNRRRHPRFRLLKPLPVVVEHGHDVSGGFLLDISRNGAQIALPGACKIGEVVLLEILGRGFLIPGVVSRSMPGTTCIAFNDNMNDGDQAARILIAEEPHISMEMCGNVARFNGYLTAVARRDFLFAAANVPQIDLSGVYGMDTAGMALCLLAQEQHKTQLQGCQKSWQSLMDVGKICAGCEAQYNCNREKVAAWKGLRRKNEYFIGE